MDARTHGGMNSRWLATWSRRTAGRRGATALMLLFTSWAMVSAGEPIELTLKNGAILQADLLDRTDERMVLDLGFIVLTIPTDQILAEGGASIGASAPSSSPPPVPVAASNQDVSTAGGKSSSRSAAGSNESFDKIVGRLKEAIVVVSNPRGLGAGFILDSSGRLMTNYHVVRGEKYHEVTLFLKKEGGRTEKKIFRRVEVQAFSALLDCAVLKIPEEQLKGIDLPILELASPDSLMTSMRVFAIGNPGVGMKILDHTVSQGILSSTNRNFNDILYLQTTAAVNPGNSGGPLLNASGEVIGLVTFKAFIQEGLAFALPVWYIKHFLEHVEAYAPLRDSKNTGYRYHDPMGEPPEEGEKK